MLSDSEGQPRHRDGEATRSRGTARWLFVVVAILGWLAIAAFGGMAQGTLSQVQENDSSAFLPASAESTRAGDRASEFTQTDTLPALVVVTSDDDAALTEEQLGAGQAFAESIGDLELPGGELVADVLTGPVVAVPSEDGEALLIPVSIDGSEADRLVGEEEDRVSIAVVEAIRAEAPNALDDAAMTAWVTGPGGFVADLVSAFGGIDGILLAVALVVVLVILVIVYRSPVLPFAVILTSVFALCLAALVIKPLAGNDVLQLNGQSQGILSILVIGAATDYSLLLVARYREELTRHRHPGAAMRAAWRASLEPIAASAGTVIAGLLCLMLSDLGSNASLGPVAAIGIAASFLAALTLLPALLLLGGARSRAVFWPRRPVFGGADVAGPQRAGLWQRVADAVTRRARPVWVVTLLGLVALAAFVPTLRADGTGESDVFRGEVEAVAGEEVLAAHFEVGQVEPIQVVVPEASGQAVIDAVTGVEGVASASLFTEDGDSAGQPGQEPAEPAEPLVVDGLVLVQVVTEASAESQEATGVAADVRVAAHEADPESLVGGAAAERLDTQETAASDLRTIVPIVLVVIFIMLVLLLRAIVAPLLLLVANVVSFAATMGLAAIVFNHVLDLPGADATVPLYGFVFLVALGIDYSIFLMTRVREESLQHGTREGVRRGLAVTGGVITSAGLVLAATFSALAVIPLLFLLQIAFIVAVGVLIDTFVVRSLLVPGLVHDIGRTVWWPWARRVPQDNRQAS
ncbi:MMPL family transporter [Pseudactinotalea suaedae]|uniref:MMPL family transporter n=1 Tax=Pseudactinotalea suaedae TaxID=1524924 RepID=UPI001F4F7A63|nr:MMPL family transporter [Pseudactinotalea suaedae]